MKEFKLIEHELDDSCLIEASAGTGKTYNICGLFLRLVVEKEIPVESLLVVTYTVAATAELRVKIRGWLRDVLTLVNGTGAGDGGVMAELAARYRDMPGAAGLLLAALRDFDRAAIHTIHGFCQKLLADNAFESGSRFETELAADDAELLIEVADDYWRTSFCSAPLPLVKYARDAGLGPDEMAAMLRRRFADPSLRVVPEEPAPGDREIARVIRVFDDAFGAAGEMWASSSTAIEAAIISGLSSLNLVMYKEEKVRRWKECIDALFAAGPLLLYGIIGSKGAEADRLNALMKFSASGLSAALKKNCECPVHPFFTLAQELLDSREAAHAVFERKMVSLKRGLFPYGRSECAARKARKNLRSFDDLLTAVHGALGRKGETLSESVGKRYAAALIDEFQDTDPVQYSIFTRLFGRKGSLLYLIGDPKQAIYGFRGADIFAYMEAVREVGSSRTLGVNRRSVPRLIGCVNALFSAHDNPFVFSDIVFNPVRDAGAGADGELMFHGAPVSPMVLWWLQSPEGTDKPVNKTFADGLVARLTASEISRLIAGKKGHGASMGGRPVMPRDIAVIVRTNDQAAMILDELRSLSVPGVLYVNKSVFSTDEAVQMKRILAAVSDPGSESAVRLTLLSPLLGFSGNALYQLIEDDRAWSDMLNRFHEYHALWSSHGVMRMFRALFDGTIEGSSARVRLLGLVDGERRVTNYLHCAELLHKAEHEGGLGMEALVKWFAAQMESVSGEGEHQIRLESDDEAVKILTIHRSKGLEFPIVFCPYLWAHSKHGAGEREMLFHDANGSLVLDLGSGDATHEAMDHRERLAENVRLMYVALTRAKKRVYFAWGRVNTTETSAPAYLFHGAGIRDSGDPVRDLAAHMATLSAPQMLRDVRQVLGAAGAEVVTTGTGEDTHFRYDRRPPSSSVIAAREFTGSIPAEWRLASYSWLSRGVHDGSAVDHDDAGSPAAAAGAGVRAPVRYDDELPAGARFGSCMHGIFEHIDYRDILGADSKRIIGEHLRMYGFTAELEGPVSALAGRVLETPLDGDGFTLGTLAPGDRINEMEFYFPLGGMTPEGLASVFEGRYLIDGTAGLPDRLAALGFRRTRGYLYGIIDMLFRHNGKYYIVDWKTNRLGASPDEYTKDRMGEAMLTELYHLQYYLYTVAANRYLSSRIGGYSYERHFGGVLYLFVRGMGTSVPGCGVYGEVPPEELVMRLDRYLAGKGEVADG